MGLSDTDSSFRSEIRERLRTVEKDIAVIQTDIGNIKDNTKDLAGYFKVLNEHHIDVERDLNKMKLDFIELKTALGTLKGTVFAGFVISGGIIGIVVFLLEYVFK